MEKEVRPNIDQWEKDGELPRDIYKKFGAMGFFSMTLPEKYGGMGLGLSDGSDVSGPSLGADWWGDVGDYV